ncbi:transposase [Alloscardovia macacae]|uniref:Transposase n=2 Tax=Alloscardovia macacae TaxID=1160091 RepID=A0A1Y2SWH3_9BIFI|nr:recombinase family protein [Alloscardovia macacae]OTA25515.1 transposase [Alloscardovia macacae]OTA28082.1 transposase [Alloscardovia macacae]
MNMAVIGYARVNSVDQNLDRQIEAIGEVDRLFVDKSSGKDAQRPQLDALRAYVREGSNDVVKVKNVDRFARSTQDLLTLLQEFTAKGVSVEFIDTPALSTSTSSGKFMLTVLAAVAKFERELIRERQREGIALAKAHGKYARGPKLSPKQIQEAHRLVDEGVPKTRVAARLGVSRWTLADALANRGIYSQNPYLRN